jgi:hypothetical protein
MVLIASEAELLKGKSAQFVPIKNAAICFYLNRMLIMQVANMLSTVTIINIITKHLFQVEIRAE